MKKFILLLLLLGCQEEKISAPKIGCAIGIRDGKMQLIRCCTHEQFLAGANEANGGISYFINYQNPQWKETGTCKECDKYK